MLTKSTARSWYLRMRPMRVISVYHVNSAEANGAAPSQWQLPVKGSSYRWTLAVQKAPYAPSGQQPPPVLAGWLAGCGLAIELCFLFAAAAGWFPPSRRAARSPR